MFLFDKQYLEFLSKAALTLAVKVVAAGSAYLMTVLVARELGVVNSSSVFLCLTIITIVSTLSRLGLDNTVVRFVAQSSVDENYDAIKHVVTKSLLWVSVASTVTCLILFSITKQMGLIFSTIPNLDMLVLLASIAIPFIALKDILARALQGLRFPVLSLTLQTLVIPVILCGALLTLDLHGALSFQKYHLAASVIGLILAVGLWWSKTRRNMPVHAKRVEGIDLWKSCFPLWVAAMLSQINLWSGQLMLGAWSSPADVSIFSVAQRTAMLINFLLVAANTVCAPRFAQAYRAGGSKELRKITRMASIFMLAAGLPLFLILLIFSDSLLSLFGADFKQGALVLRVLAFGQFVNLATGSVAFVLMMTGHESIVRNNLFISACIGLVAGLMLIPFYGILGAAISTTLAISLQNLLGVVSVKRLHGFNTLMVWKK